MIESSIVVLTLMISMDLFHLGIKHYGLLGENSLECKRSLALARKRDKDFLESFIEMKAIPWQFTLDGVRYTMTCAMDTVLMSLFLLWHRKVLPDKAIRRHPPPLADVLKHIKDGEHALARKLFIDMNTNKADGRFGKAKIGDNPFNCLFTLFESMHYCTLVQFDLTEVTYECSKCKNPKKVHKRVKVYKVGSVIHSDISSPQEKIITEKGYNGKVTIPCPVRASEYVSSD